MSYMDDMNSTTTFVIGAFMGTACFMISDASVGMSIAVGIAFGIFLVAVKLYDELNTLRNREDD